MGQTAFFRNRVYMESTTRSAKKGVCPLFSAFFSDLLASDAAERQVFDFEIVVDSVLRALAA